MIPGWMAEADPAPAPSVRSGRKSFLEKTLAGAAAVTEATFLHESPGRGGLLRKLDPRSTLLTVVAVIVTVTIVRSPAIAWGVFLAALLLAHDAGIGLLPFARRIGAVVLLFAVVPALPALCNLVTPGEPVLVVAQLGKGRVLGPWHIPAELTLTRQGLRVAAIFSGRVAASVALASLLPLTTPWNRILQSLRLFRVPQLFVLVLAMTYRYIALLVRTVAELHTARKSRTVRYLPTGTEQRWVAARLGYLFARSYRLSLGVHDAMVARGFAGEIKTLTPPAFRGRDIVAVSVVPVICTALVLGDRLL